MLDKDTNDHSKNGRINYLTVNLKWVPEIYDITCGMGVYLCHIQFKTIQE